MWRLPAAPALLYPRRMTITGDIETTTEPLPDGRHTATVPIGSRTYTVYEPKLAAWMALAQQAEAATSARAVDMNRASRRMFDKKQRRAAAGGMDAETMTRLELNNILIGVLEASMTAEDLAVLDDELTNPRSELDLPHLWGASASIIREFQPYMEARAKSMNLVVPSLSILTEPATTAAQKVVAAPRKAAARKATPAKATPAKAARKATPARAKRP